VVVALDPARGTYLRIGRHKCQLQGGSLHMQGVLAFGQPTSKRSRVCREGARSLGTTSLKVLPRGPVRNLERPAGGFESPAATSPCAEKDGRRNTSTGNRWTLGLPPAGLGACPSDNTSLLQQPGASLQASSEPIDSRRQMLAGVSGSSVSSLRDESSLVNPSVLYGSSNAKTQASSSSLAAIWRSV